MSTALAMALVAILISSISVWVTYRVFIATKDKENDTLLSLQTIINDLSIELKQLEAKTARERKVDTDALGVLAMEVSELSKLKKVAEVREEVLRSPSKTRRKKTEAKADA